MSELDPMTRVGNALIKISRTLSAIAADVKGLRERDAARDDLLAEKLEELSEELVKKLGEQSERSEKRDDRAEHALSELQRLLNASSADLPRILDQIKEARDDIDDLTPPMGTPLIDLRSLAPPLPPPITAKVEDSTEDMVRNARGTWALVKKAWPAIKWLSAVGGGAVVAKLIAWLSGHR